MSFLSCPSVSLHTVLCFEANGNAWDYLAKIYRNREQSRLYLPRSVPGSPLLILNKYNVGKITNSSLSLFLLFFLFFVILLFF